MTKRELQRRRSQSRTEGRYARARAVWVQLAESKFKHEEKPTKEAFAVALHQVRPELNRSTRRGLGDRGYSQADGKMAPSVRTRR